MHDDQKAFPTRVVGLESKLMPSYRDYFAEIKKRIKEATPQQVADLLRSGDIQLADVREKNEWDEGHLPGAVHLPKSYLEQWAEDRIPDKDKTTILYCAGGVRSAMAADTLAQLGYRHVVSMSGGFNRWKDSGLPWKKPDAGLTPEQAQRYSRHLLIPEVGESGQQQLLRSKVLLIGAGDLRVHPLARRGGRDLRCRPRPLRRPRHPLRLPHRRDECLESDRVRGHWSARVTPGHPLARAPRALRRDALLERLGESGGAHDPRADAGLGRSCRRSADAARVPVAASQLPPRDDGRDLRRHRRDVPQLG